MVDHHLSLPSWNEHSGAYKQPVGAAKCLFRGRGDATPPTGSQGPCRRSDQPGSVQSGGPESGPTAMPFGSHSIDVAEADAPELGTAVTLTFALQA